MRRKSDGNNTPRQSGSRLLLGCLWFVTGFCLSCSLRYISQQNVSKFVVHSDMGQKQGQMTRLFVFESETEQSNQQQVKSNESQPYQPQNQNDQVGATQQWNSDTQNQRKRDPKVMMMSDEELEQLTLLDAELKHGLEDIGQEVVDDEMLAEIGGKESLNVYHRYPTAWDVMNRQKCFLFIGVLTSPKRSQERAAQREAWIDDANQMQDVIIRFVMLESERTLEVEKEVNEHMDFLFVTQQTRQYKQALHKVYRLFEHVAENYQASFVLKTDDVAYVNVPVLVHYLHQQCMNEDCLHERLYIGYEQSNSPVFRDTSQSEFNQWINQKYYEVVKSDQYIPYMMGGGYILSGDLVELIISMQQNIGLFWSPIEDGTIGMWLAGLNVRRVSDQHSFLTQDFECCFHEFPDMKWHPWIGYNRLVVDVCKTDNPRLILHSIQNSTFMKTLGWRVRKCDFSALLGTQS
eukprot:TRINITY_DN1385_c0_g2_i2.p1 TRINITY_DN1385_c0_g2~~TRINITY_DN1385_c0_g2_i2.p1  ORF type:complete len:462 (+),score=39.24 TRINITY_DN1385_c0_g2_i2:339-1724(+)